MDLANRIEALLGSIEWTNLADAKKKALEELPNWEVIEKNMLDLANSAATNGSLAPQEIYRINDIARLCSEVKVFLERIVDPQGQPSIDQQVTINKFKATIPAYKEGFDWLNQHFSARLTALESGTARIKESVDVLDAPRPQPAERNTRARIEEPAPADQQIKVTGSGGGSSEYLGEDQYVQLHKTLTGAGRPPGGVPIPEPPQEPQPAAPAQVPIDVVPPEREFTQPPQDAPQRVELHVAPEQPKPGEELREQDEHPKVPRASTRVERQHRSQAANSTPPPDDPRQ